MSLAHSVAGGVSLSRVGTTTDALLDTKMAGKHRVTVGATTTASMVGRELKLPPGKTGLGSHVAHNMTLGHSSDTSLHVRSPVSGSAIGTTGSAANTTGVPLSNKAVKVTASVAAPAPGYVANPGTNATGVHAYINCP